MTTILLIDEPVKVYMPRYKYDDVVLALPSQFYKMIIICWCLLPYSSIHGQPKAHKCGMETVSAFLVLIIFNYIMLCYCTRILLYTVRISMPTSGVYESKNTELENGSNQKN